MTKRQFIQQFVISYIHGRTQKIDHAYVVGEAHKAWAEIEASLGRNSK